MCSGSTGDFGLSNGYELLNKFLSSRASGLSPQTIKFYRKDLTRAIGLIRPDATPQEIQSFINNLPCNAGGKHAYFRALRAFFNWLYSPKSGYKLVLQDNPILAVDPPKRPQRIAPSLTPEEVNYLIDQAGCVRNKAIIALFAESGLRLSELVNIEVDKIDWEHQTIKVIGKGNKQALAPFGERSKVLLQQWLAEYNNGNKLWDINVNGMSKLFRTLRLKTGLPCNPHTFRRTFATLLAKNGVDSLHIMRLGRWSSMQMVDLYTKSIKFEDSLEFYKRTPILKD